MKKENPTNRKACRVEDTKTDYNPKSTGTEAQRQRLLAALRLRPHYSHELRKQGIYMPNCRVFELRNKGYNITTHLTDIVDDDGYAYRGIALYSLWEGKQ